MCFKMIKKKIAAIKGASDLVFITYVLGKMLAGIGLGVVIAGLVYSIENAVWWGIGTIVLAFVVSWPAIVAVWKKVWAKKR